MLPETSMFAVAPAPAELRKPFCTLFDDVQRMQDSRATEPEGVAFATNPEKLSAATESLIEALVVLPAAPCTLKPKPVLLVPRNCDPATSTVAPLVTFMALLLPRIRLLTTFTLAAAWIKTPNPNREMTQFSMVSESPADMKMPRLPESPTLLRFNPRRT